MLPQLAFPMREAAQCTISAAALQLWPSKVAETNGVRGSSVTFCAHQPVIHHSNNSAIIDNEFLKILIEEAKKGDFKSQTVGPCPTYFRWVRGDAGPRCPGHRAFWYQMQSLDSGEEMLPENRTREHHKAARQLVTLVRRRSFGFQWRWLQQLDLDIPRV